jgi:IclR family acetate operon transcriptional repressor
MTVRQAANVLDLLEYFARRQQPATLSDISQDLDWPRSSTFNILETLIERGYIYTPNARFGYYPTSRWLVHTMAISDAMPVPERVYQLVGDLAEETGETVSLAVPSGLHVVLTYVVESKAVIRYSAEVGKLLPIHSSAAGRAILCQYNKAARNAILSKVSYIQYQPNSMMSAEAVLQDIARAEARGWFESNTEFTPDVSGLALKLPILGRKMAIAIGGPSFRMQPRIETIGKLANERVSVLLNDARNGAFEPLASDSLQSAPREPTSY